MLKEDGALKKGQDIIKGYQKTLPDTAGVYRMLDEHENVLYVGKAKSLKKRVVSYTHVEKLSRRIQMMVMQTHTMEFVHTNTEAEALLLEANLIKKLKPRYNILLRDDKSFPYIFLSEDHDYPVVTKHRGAHKRKGRYFGPFANASAVTRTINILQKVFMLRNCTDNVFANRSRPCLQYHIKRCTAPCVDYVSKQGYAEQVKQAQDFLDGKSESIKDIFVQQMQEASAEQDYERAAQLRDRVKALSAVQGHQDINIAKLGDADVIALSRKSGVSCIQVFFFRAGRNYGNHAYFPRHKAEDTEQDVLTSFIGQFYANKPVPPSIYVSHDVTDQSVVEDALSSLNRSSEARVKLLKPQRGDKRRIVVFAEGNASDALDLELIKRSTQQELLAKLKDVFGLDKVPERIEVYDNSHTSGTNMVGAMIVSGPEGFQKKCIS
jgi:excinuclease ABC subunit C